MNVLYLLGHRTFAGVSTKLNRGAMSEDHSMDSAVAEQSLVANNLFSQAANNESNLPRSGAGSFVNFNKPLDGAGALPISKCLLVHMTFPRLRLEMHNIWHGQTLSTITDVVGVTPKVPIRQAVRAPKLPRGGV